MEVYVSDILISCLRWLIGLLVGSLLGIFFGLITFYLKPINQMSKILFNFFRSIPIIGLVPVIQMAFGVSEFGKIGLISWGVFFPVWLSVQSAMNRKIPELELVFKCIRLTLKEKIFVYHLPKVLGGIILGVQVGIGIGWLCVVAAELIGTFSQGFWAGGMGYKLFLAHDNNDWYTVLSILFIFGLLGYLSSTLWDKFLKSYIFKQKAFNPIIWIERG